MAVRRHDGDGRTDIFQPWNNNGTLGLIAYRATGTGYTAAFTSGNMGQGSGALAWLVGDMDGDGRSDIFQPFNNSGALGLIVYRSSGTGFAAAFTSGNIGVGSGSSTGDHASPCCTRFPPTESRRCGSMV